AKEVAIDQWLNAKWGDFKNKK
ncbi:MAG: hypothetical protein RL521_232, partial [Bacteroidota bacterium]